MQLYMLLLNDFILRFFATGVGLSFALVGGCPVHVLFLATVAGGLVDYMRYKVSPEMMGKAAENTEKFRPPQKTNSYQFNLGKKFMLFRAMLILLWIVIALVLSKTTSYQVPPSFPEGKVLDFLVKVTGEVFPTVSSSGFIERNISSPFISDFGRRLYAVTWWFMVGSVIIEITGGTYSWLVDRSVSSPAAFLSPSTKNSPLSSKAVVAISIALTVATYYSVQILWILSWAGVIPEASGGNIVSMLFEGCIGLLCLPYFIAMTYGQILREKRQLQ